MHTPIYFAIFLPCLAPLVNNGYIHLVLYSVVYYNAFYSRLFLIQFQEWYPYVVWNPPDEANGVITGYRLVFSRSGTSTTRTRTTTTDQTFYIIQSSDIPWTSGDFRVTVSLFPYSFHISDFSSCFPLTFHRLQLETVMVLELHHQLSHSQLILHAVCNKPYFKPICCM